MALKRTRVISNAPELGTIWAQVPGPVVHTGPLVEKCDVDDFMGRGTSEKHVVPLLLVLQLGVREMLGYELNALAIVLRFEFVGVDDDCVALLRRMNAGKPAHRAASSLSPSRFRSWLRDRACGNGRAVANDGAPALETAQDVRQTRPDAAHQRAEE